MKNISTKSKGMIAILIFIFTGIMSLAYANDTQHDELVNHAIMASGIDQQVASFDQVLSNSINQVIALDDKLNGSEREYLNSIFTSNFSSQKFLEDFKKILSTNLTDNDLITKLAIYNNLVIKKFIEAEIAHSKPDAMQDFMIYAAKIGQNPPGKARLELIKRLDTATKTSEATKIMTVHMFETMVTNMNILHPKFTAEKLERMINNYAIVVERTVSNQVILGYLYTYKDFTDKELDSYVKLYETNTGLKKFNDTLLFAINDYFDGYAIRVANDMIDFIKLQGSYNT